jgi:hypothetical protein
MPLQSKKIQPFFQHAFSFRRNAKASEVLVTLNHLPKLAEFAAAEVTLSFYPYDKNLDADSFRFLPYQEYLEDVQHGQRTTYQPSNFIGDKFFGLWLSTMAFSLVGLLNPTKLYTLEAVLSILGAYALGKELWNDVDDFLIRLTKNWSLQWHEADYYYQREDFGTVQRFAQFARLKRYGNETTLASKLDFVTHSNSQTIDLYFRHSDLSHPNQKSARILSCEFVEPKKVRKSKVKGLWTAKISVHKSLLGFRLVQEAFQAEDATVSGTLDVGNHWKKGKVRVRQYLKIGRLSWQFTKDQYLTGNLFE